MASKGVSSFARRVGKAVVGRILAAQPGSKRRMIPLSGPRLLPPESRRLSRDRDHRNGAGEIAVEGDADIVEVGLAQDQRRLLSNNTHGIKQNN